MEGFTLWFTGLPSSGKTTLGQCIAEDLKKLSINSIVLDGDVLRRGLNKDLDYSPQARHENIRRVAEVATLFARNGSASIVTFISPYDKDRKMARILHKTHSIPFYEIFLQTSLEECEKRDVKGLYKLARENIIKDMTGIQSPYEKPENAEICLDTEMYNIKECVDIIISHIKNNICKKYQSLEIPELFGYGKEELNHITNGELSVKIELTAIDLQWIQVLTEGWAYPLKGFMTEIQYLQCLHFNMIKEKDQWHLMSLPIVLCINESQKNRIQSLGINSIKLIYKDKFIGILKNIDIYPHRKEERAARKFSTVSKNHPVVKMIMESEEWLIGGDLEIFEKIVWKDGLDEYRLTPNEIKKKIKDGGHDAVYAFQLRNPIHNGHALLINKTYNMLKERGYKSPLLLLHPLGGYTKDDDVPLYHRIKQHEALFDEHVLDADKTILAIFPSPMSYGGPTEVLWHCKARMICGANYYIVGRDPAGLPHPEYEKTDLFDPTHGAKVLVNAPLIQDLEIVPFPVVAYNKHSHSMEIVITGEEQHYEFISGTKMRRIARDGQEPPKGFMAPKAWKVISEYYRSLCDN
ncbi:hypothetical protein HZS_3918 [Henneguya salminicola]|uniref:Bifunctional 3'-phosphoadenosine 5'-phosphosulfate synthase 1 (Trinotate prediction) n=1 Tax=Henneguya salminicola TaxID=69463 RepID=A0A6G3MDX9_HENSL|nr:hypothetical protein HZS_3918 [Henneguya salminicola]